MIELPRAALRADEIAAGEDGRRVLLVRHQRPDADLPRPVARRCGADPRQLRASRRSSRSIRSCRSISDGVGELVRIGTERGRKARPDLKVGICGEHGGDPASIAFCHADRARLRVLLALPRAGRAPRRGAGRDQGEGSRTDPIDVGGARRSTRSIASARRPGADRARRGDCGRGGGDARASSGRRAAPRASGRRQS